VILRTAQSSSDPGMVGNLLPSRLAGAHIRLATPAGAQADLLQKLKAELQAEGKAPYVFPSGGSNSRGSWGYIQAPMPAGPHLEAAPICACPSSPLPLLFTTAAHRPSPNWSRK
jgi:1-aminocyclopropane-1-carboxylate deaminase/D-cysteine desulfhydrase-like pyridoxal-dependent ACC family enzyme